MLIDSVTNVIRTLADHVRTTEWRTVRDETNGQLYHYSRTYTVRLYNRLGVECVYTNDRTVDLKC